MGLSKKTEHFIGELVYHNGGNWGLGYIVNKYKSGNKKNAPWRYDVEWSIEMDEGYPFVSTGYSSCHIVSFKLMLQRVQNGENISAQGW